MNVSAVQFKARKGAHAESLDALTELASSAAQDAHLVVMPEMAVSGYMFEDEASARGIAEPATGPTFQRLAPIAREHATWMVCGFAETDQGALYNSAMVIDDQGELAFTYRKSMLYEADETWARPGNSGYRRFETAHGAFGLGICMDINDPRFIMWCWRSRLDVLAFPTNWVEEGVDVWQYWQARLVGSGVALVAANTYGVEPGVRFCGRSVILRGGDILQSAGREGDAVIRALVEVDARTLRR